MEQVVGEAKTLIAQFERDGGEHMTDKMLKNVENKLENLVRKDRHCLDIVWHYIFSRGMLARKQHIGRIAARQ